MNYSMYGADRLTHLKIVVVALVGAILVAGVGIAASGMQGDSQAIARAQQDGRVAQGYGPVVKAGAPVVMTEQATTTIR